MHILYGFPIPPTANKQLTLANGRMVKTQEARLFTEKVKIYCLKNIRKLNEIRKDIPQNTMLQVDCFFVFLESRLVGKKGQTKALDANNFVKSCLDGVAIALEIDDRFFVANHVEKVSCQKSSDEQTIITIIPTLIRTLDQLKSDLTLSFNRGAQL